MGRRRHRSTPDARRGLYAWCGPVAALPTDGRRGGAAQRRCRPERDHSNQPMTEPATATPSTRWDALPRSRRRQLLGGAVVSLVRERPPGPGALGHFMNGDPARQLAALATVHRLPGLVSRRLANLGVEGELTEQLAAAHSAAAAHAFGLLAELVGVAEHFAERRIPWMLVKGLALAQLAYGDHGLRNTLDLDLVVPPSSFPAALDAVESAGGVLRQQNWPLLTRLRLGQIVVRLPLGAYGDLHWHLVNTPEARARFQIPMAELFERRQQVDLGPLAVATLDPIDTVLHLCVHGALSGGHLLVWLKDVERSVDAGTNGPGWSWDVLVNRARRYGLGLVCAVMLERARVVLEAEVPADVVDALAPKSPVVAWWSSFDRRGARHWNAEAGTGKTLMGATASSTATTLGALARRVRQDVVAPRTRDAAGRLPGVRVAPRPLLVDQHGGPAERRRYLDAVATEARQAGSWMGATGGTGWNGPVGTSGRAGPG